MKHKTSGSTSLQEDYSLKLCFLTSVHARHFGCTGPLPLPFTLLFPILFNFTVRVCSRVEALLVHMMQQTVQATHIHSLGSSVNARPLTNLGVDLSTQSCNGRVVGRTAHTHSVYGGGVSHYYHLSHATLQQHNEGHTHPLCATPIHCRSRPPTTPVIFRRRVMES